MTFHELCDKTRTIAATRLTAHTVEDLEEEGDFGALVLSVIDAMDFHVSDNGEVCDPRPAPPSAPRQQNVRYIGSGRKRRR